MPLFFQIIFLLMVSTSCGPSSSSELSVLGKDTFSTKPTQAPPGLALLFIKEQSAQSDAPTTSMCSASYIASGVLITAGHCLKSEGLHHTINNITLTFSGFTLTLKAYQFNLVIHPHKDLGLLFFDPDLLPHSLPPIKLFNPPKGTGHKKLYSNTEFFGWGGLSEHPHYHGSFILRGAKELAVITEVFTYSPFNNHLSQPLNQLLLHSHTKFLLELTRFNPCLIKEPPSQDWKKALFRFFCHNNTVSPSLMLATASIRENPSSSRSPNRREVLFCPGDSGGGLLNSQGELMGVLTGIPTKAREPEHYDPKALELGCHHLAFFVDLNSYLLWIEERIRFR